ncbi:uncharacterized protein K444DRAFT_668797 [Hyaloscypha bicolor E]|uniref:Uncharacterized protein n=1 Tax=Hyaloscypha bicolor E TaxID=1095630 RepID=A0A2J6SP36_9HELO|nr:uncharacterized protein K444DRAFT_668797 [Hyaloscypha bicolor E]PMD52493.1 hypothetical protein K444DRAFT_668797 [Hyaloscypha bicolor E]
MNGPLQLAFFAVKLLSLRALMAPETPELKSNSTSCLCYHYPSALVEGESFVNLMAQLSSTTLRNFWPRHSRTNLIISTNFVIYLFFCGSTEEQVAKAYDLLQKHQGALREMVKISDWATIGLVRPSLLRTESFFHGAVKGIRLAEK